LPITSSRMGHLWDALEHAYRVLGFEAAAGDPVFRGLVLARIIEPTSKLDSARVLEEVGVSAPAYRTVTRRLPVFAQEDFRRKLAAVCARQAGLGPASLVLYDVSTLYFETDAGDGFREPGFSKERRLEPQITIGLLTDHTGFPLMVEAFEGNKAETLTMIPTIQAFMAAHGLPDVTIVADAGMVSEANKKAIEAAGLSFIIGSEDPPGAVRHHPPGGSDTPTPRSRTGTSLPSPGRPGRPMPAVTTRSTTSTSTTGPGAPCAGSTSRSPRPRRPSRARRRSNGTGSSPSPGPASPSTVRWRPRPGRWLGSRRT
jgi:hypothetical protein